MKRCAPWCAGCWGKKTEDMRPLTSLEHGDRVARKSTARSEIGVLRGFTWAGKGDRRRLRALVRFGGVEPYEQFNDVTDLMRVLDPGARAFMIVGDRSPSGRLTVQGAAQVRIISAEGDRYLVEVIRSTPGGLIAGSRITTARADLHAGADPIERRAFKEKVQRVWPSRMAP